MKLVAIGDCLVDRYSSHGVMFAGGNALNVSVFAARQGASVRFIGAVGDDAAGSVILDNARAENVDVSLVLRRVGASAQANVELIGGDRIFVSSTKGVSVFDPTEDHLAAVASSDVVHTGHSSAMEEHLSALSSRAPVSFDFSFRHEPEYLERVMPHVRYAHFSGGALSHADRTALAELALSYAPVSVLVTAGSGGADYYEDGAVWHQPARPVSVVDTLGAGDTMIAALLIRRLSGDLPAQALEIAAAAAAQTCTRLGAFGDSAPTDRPSLEAVPAARHPTSIRQGGPTNPR